MASMVSADEGRQLESAAADAADEILEDALAELAVRDLRMELHAVDVPRGMHHRRDRTVVGRAQHLEAVRQLLHRIAVAHPHLAVVGHSVEQLAAVGNAVRRAGLRPARNFNFANPYSRE